MGMVKDESGLTVQLYDDSGRPEGAPIFGRHVEIYGRPRAEIVAGGGPLTAEEQSVPGSDDWLTLVAVADSEDRLAEILRTTDVDATIPHTSHSSRRVLVEIHVGDQRRTLRGRTTVASGPVVSLPPRPMIKVAHLKVLPEAAELAAGHPMSAEFTGGSEL